MGKPAKSSLLLVSENYPPLVGGSAVLFQMLYSRLDRVTVLTDKTISPGEDEKLGSMTVLRRRIAAPYWGLLRPRGLLHHQIGRASCRERV